MRYLQEGKVCFLVLVFVVFLQDKTLPRFWVATLRHHTRGTSTVSGKTKVQHVENSSGVREGIGNHDKEYIDEEKNQHSQIDLRDSGTSHCWSS